MKLNSSLNKNKKKHIHIDKERKKKSWKEFMKTTLKIPRTFQVELERVHERNFENSMNFPSNFNLDSVIQGAKT